MALAVTTALAATVTATATGSENLKLPVRCQCTYAMTFHITFLQSYNIRMCDLHYHKLRVTQSPDQELQKQGLPTKSVRLPGATTRAITPTAS